MRVKQAQPQCPRLAELSGQGIVFNHIVDRMSCGLWILLYSHRLSEFRWGYWHCAASSCCSAERNQSITNKLKNNIITEKSTLHPILNPKPKPNNNCFLPYKGEIVTQSRMQAIDYGCCCILFCSIPNTIF